MNRLFVALKIPEDIRETIIKIRNDAVPNPQKHKWEDKNKIHLTLKFIGEVKDELIQPIVKRILFIEEYKKINCKLSKFGFFYRNGKPSILWLGLNINSEIYNLVEKLNKELESFSIPIEYKRFKPHLTIKRLKGNEDKEFVNNFENVNVPEINFTANEVSLIKSELLPAGSEYKELKNYNLK